MILNKLVLSPFADHEYLVLKFCLQKMAYYRGKIWQIPYIVLLSTKWQTDKSHVVYEWIMTFQMTEALQISHTCTDPEAQSHLVGSVDINRQYILAGDGHISHRRRQSPLETS